MANYNTFQILQEAFTKIKQKISKKTYCFNSVAEMKAYTGFKNGDICITSGYYSANDGGGAKYQITDTLYDTYLQANISDDGGSVHTLAASGLYAKIICDDNEIRPEQFGAKGYLPSECNDANISTLFDSTDAFTTIINYAYRNNTNKGRYTIRLSAKTYFVHELNMSVNAMLIKGVNPYTSKLVYNGDGGIGSYLINANSTATGGLVDAALNGCHKKDGNACEYAFINYNASDGNVDWGSTFENVCFKYFLKGAFKINGVNIHMQHIRFDACNEFAIELGSCASFSLKDFTTDYVVRENPNFLSQVAVINGASSKCGYGMMFVNRDVEANVTGAILVDSGRVEGQTWLRTYNGTYSHFRINSGAAYGNITLKNLEGGTYGDYDKLQYSTNLVEFTRSPIGVTLIGCTGTTYKNAVLYNKDVDKNQNIEYSRLGTMKQLEIYSPSRKEGTNGYKLSNGILLDGKSFGISQNREYTYDFYKYGDILFRQLDSTASNIGTNIGWICVYPLIGSGQHAPTVTSETVSVVLNENTIANRFFVGGAYVITYSDASTQDVMCTAMNEETGIATFNNNFTKTDSSASIALAKCKWASFGQIGDTIE